MRQVAARIAIRTIYPVRLHWVRRSGSQTIISVHITAPRGLFHTPAGWLRAKRDPCNLERHGERVPEICFQKRERFCVRKLYQSYGEKQGESGDFFSLKATCFQKKYGFKNESFFQVKETSLQVEETSFSSDNFALRKWRLPLS